MTNNRPAKNPESGVAIIMVMTTIMLLMIILANFSFDTDLNKLKIFNAQDRAQAKLNAEAGLSFAMSKLRLYQEARNTLEKNKSLKEVIPEGKLQSMMTEPLIYPPPVPESADIIQKTALKDFTESSLIQGNISVTIAPIKGFLNPNNLRLPDLAPNSQSQDQGYLTDSQIEEQNKKDEEAKNRQSNIEKEIVKIIEDQIKRKIEENPENSLLFGEVDAKLLVKELKFFVNDKGKFTDDEKSDIENIYSEAEITPKYAPMTSLSEMYLLAGWNDQLVNLIIDRLTVHESGIIIVNELTENQLRMLFPRIEEEQVDNFFRYRDGASEVSEDEMDEDTKPHPFKDIDGFKKAVTGELAIIEESAYEERIAELKKAGLSLGIAGKLFRVSSRGEMRNAVYQLEAIVDLPIKELPFKTTETTKKDSTNQTKMVDDNAGSTKKTSKSEKKEAPVEFLLPRIVEITIQ
ncbi:MAG: general secretion pathway protein GspK [Bacteriovoracaceae bacterium]|nr:general secretion pathway protein GspK [Bacteriovoracaceae bacterium]